MQLPEKFIVLDTETTGLGVDDEIVQIGIIDQDGKTLMDTLIKPLKPIPSAATFIHNISNDMVADAPTFTIIYPELITLINDNHTYIYNADYDLRMIAQSKELNKIPDLTSLRIKPNYTCVMLEYAQFYGEWDYHRMAYRWHRLTNAAREQNIEIKNAHSAIGDCLMTLALMRKMEQAFKTKIREQAFNLK